MWTSFIGFMACGKSTLTQRLGAISGWPMVSVDQVVSLDSGRSISDLFAAEGEAAFRSRETAALAALTSGEQLIVDPGGGVVESPEAVEILRRQGVVIWLDTPWAVILNRLKETETGSRPLIGQLGWAGLEGLFRRRRFLYAQAADFRLRSDRGTADQIARKAMLQSILWRRRHEEDQD